MIIDELFESPQLCPECGGPSFTDLILAEKKDACYHKIKASAKVWPSAYASGRLVQCRKKGAANYGNKSEGVTEGNDDHVWGPQGRFAGDTKVDVGGVTMKRLAVGEKVKYDGIPVTVNSIHPNGQTCEVEDRNGRVYRGVRVRDLNQLGQGVAESIEEDPLDLGSDYALYIADAGRKMMTQLTNMYKKIQTDSAAAQNAKRWSLGDFMHQHYEIDDLTAINQVFEEYGVGGFFDQNLYELLAGWSAQGPEYVDTWKQYSGDVIKNSTRKPSGTMHEQGVGEGSLEEIDRRGFLKGLGAAAVAGAAGSAMAQSRPVDVSREFQNMRQDDPRVQHNKDIEEMARAIYEQIVATRGQPIDRRQQQMWMTIAREKATEKLSKYAPGRPAPQSQSSGFPSQGSERRVSRNIDNFESQGVAESEVERDKHYYLRNNIWRVMDGDELVHEYTPDRYEVVGAKKLLARFDDEGYDVTHVISPMGVVTYLYGKPENDMDEGMMSNPGQEDSPVAQAIIRRILLQRTDLLAKHGPEKVGQAVDEVADFVGDVDEIGSSDVSGWVRHVEQMLGNMPEGVTEIRDRRDAYQRDYDNSVAGMGQRQSYAYSQDGGANDEDHSRDEEFAAQQAKKQQYERTGNFWLKKKDTQQHISDVFVGKAAANQAALDLLKQQPELRGNIVITAYGPGEQTE